MPDAAWLHALAVIHLPLSIASGVLVLADILLLGRRQAMAVMDAVWPLTMLYFGPLGLVFYGWFGRAPAAAQAHQHGAAPLWQAVFKGAAHCGAGCAVGDMLGEWVALARHVTLAGSALAARMALALALAYLFGLLFQYLAIAPMRRLGLRAGLVAAVQADTLSLLAYEVGMFAAMAGTAWALPGLAPGHWSYWLMMQAAMLLGFLTTMPVNLWLIRRGIKERM